MTRPPPRLFGIPARAPIVAVLRRGPSDWSHVGRWLSCFTLKAGARWDVGGTYVAIPRLPWLTALAAWPTCGTWTSGYHFVDDRDVWEVGVPRIGDVSTLRRTYGMALTRAATFAVERRRGWTETAETPPPAPSDAWDEQRARRVTMENVGSTRRSGRTGRPTVACSSRRAMAVCRSATASR